MGAYLLKRLLLIIPTLFGIMVINFAVIQIVPGGPVEQMIAQMTGTAIESTARFSGGNEGETLEFSSNSSSVNDSKYRGAQGLDPDIIKEIPSENAILIDSLGGIIESGLDKNKDEWLIFINKFLNCISKQDKLIIIVNEETGWGVIPSTAIGHLFRERLTLLSSEVSKVAKQRWLVLHQIAIDLDNIGVPII